MTFVGIRLGEADEIVKCVPGIGPPEGRRYGTITKSADREQWDEDSPSRVRGPVHSHRGAAERTFSVHLGKNAFQCFHADYGVKGNVLDLWAAIHRLPLYEGALHLAETLNLTRSREKEPLARTRSAQESASPPRAKVVHPTGGPR
jgi:hypothetical protein